MGHPNILFSLLAFTTPKSSGCSVYDDRERQVPLVTEYLRPYCAHLLFLNSRWLHTFTLKSLLSSLSVYAAIFPSGSLE